MFKWTLSNLRSLKPRWWSPAFWFLPLLPLTLLVQPAGFDDVWLKISDYMQGSLGKVLIGLIVLVGLAAAVVRQSLMSLAVAVGGAISCTTHRTLSMAWWPHPTQCKPLYRHSCNHHGCKKNRLWPVFLHLHILFPAHRKFHNPM